jgi:flagellar hook-length control protein FliK
VRASSVSHGFALVDAIRVATAGRGTADQHQDFNRDAATGSERRATKVPVHGLQVAEAVHFDRALNASVTTAALPALPNEDTVVSSIVQSMRLQMRDGVGTAVIHLEPDYLGAVSIALRVEDGVVTATLRAENAQVRAWMEANESLLRDSLASQGLSLDRLLVTDERIADQHSADRREQQEQQQRERPRPRPEHTAAFEVVV